SLQVHLKEASYALLHPRLQKTIDYFVDDDTHYLIKEYIPGQTLRQSMAQKQQPAYYYKIIVDVLEVLNSLHRHQIFHCDIKPENILMGNQVYVLDLGLAFNRDVDTHCQSNFALGYAAPELMLQQPSFINAGTDVFALAMCLYHCLTGSNPFFHQHPVYAMQLQLNLPLPPHKKINKNLLAVLHKATYRQSFGRPPHQLTAAAINEVLQINNQKRYQSVEEFTAALLPCF
ncbi:MAG TPA: protein kinase, partial [Bacteroidia bacterium]|nr:protein kinase [Bacteroidia bacterium]